jgi:hypothetical protein
LAIVVLRSCGHLKVIFDGQAMALDLSIGNFDLLGMGALLDA